MIRMICRILPALFALTAGSTAWAASALDECFKAYALHTEGTAACDRLIEEATLAGDAETIALAYMTRALQHEYANDLPAALADIEQARQLLPGTPIIEMHHAKFIAESGDYDGALKKFAALPKPAPEDDMDTTLAMLEYVVGDPTKSIALFRSAAAFSLRYDAKMADYLNYNAAIIESELKGGDTGPLKAMGADHATGSLLYSLGRYRTGLMTEAEFEALIPDMAATRSNACTSYFAIGHRNALAGNEAAARAAFQNAADGCPADRFELHAARKWLKKLGA